MLGLRRQARRHVVSNDIRLLVKAFARTTRTASTRVSESIREEERRQAARLASRQDWHQRYALYGALAVSGVMGLYISQLAYGLVRASQEAEAIELSQQKDVAGRYEEIADTFDNEVNYSEWLMGILKMRASLSQMCIGNTLEVSCGTGRNLGYFDLDAKDKKMTSLTLIDLSPQMVQVCKRKFLALRAGRAGSKGSIPIRFATGSALGDMPQAPDGNKYDTILQTMGLCSTPSPEDLIVNMARHLNLENPDACIILLEHGRSYYQWLNNVLDNSATKHAELFGCWYNRDLDAIVHEAAKKADLQVVSAKRFHLGTTYMYELKAGPRGKKTTDIADLPASSSFLKRWLGIDLRTA